jgi:hypothetical protein
MAVRELLHRERAGGARQVPQQVRLQGGQGQFLARADRRGGVGVGVHGSSPRVRSGAKKVSGTFSEAKKVPDTFFA